MSNNVIYLSKRNLLTLLNKLARYEAGENTQCSLIKYPNHLDPYSMSIDGVNEHDGVTVTAIPDHKYYVGRSPGEVLPEDDPEQRVTVDFVSSLINA